MMREIVVTLRCIVNRVACICVSNERIKFYADDRSISWRLTSPYIDSSPVIAVALRYKFVREIPLYSQLFASPYI